MGGHDERFGSVEVRPNHTTGESYRALRTAYRRRALRDLSPNRIVDLPLDHPERRAAGYTALPSFTWRKLNVR